MFYFINSKYYACIVPKQFYGSVLNLLNYDADNCMHHLCTFIFHLFGKCNKTDRIYCIIHIMQA